MQASADTARTMASAPPQARVSRKPEAAGAAKAASTAARPTEHTGANRGATTAFAIGDASGTCENIAADSGVARMLDAPVRASASPTKRGRRGKRRASQAVPKPANSTMPSVESAESAKDTDSAVCGFTTMHPTMHAASALRAAGRRRAANESIPAKAMTAALTAEGGAADSTR